MPDCYWACFFGFKVFSQCKILFSLPFHGLVKARIITTMMNGGEKMLSSLRFFLKTLQIPITFSERVFSFFIGGDYSALGLSGDIIASSFGKAMHHGHMKSDDSPGMSTGMEYFCSSICACYLIRPFTHPTHKHITSFSFCSFMFWSTMLLVT